MPTLNKSRILIVDDHPAMREGLRAILQSVDDLVVCGEAENGEKAIAAVEELQPDMAIVDISLREKLDGLELTRRLRRRWPALPILTFSLHQGTAYCDAAIAAGALGYCAKGEPSKVVIKAVHEVLQGKKFISKLARTNSSRS
jgi:two-component system, NarL family, nitrate/nitrite response regulator NarL